MIDQQRHDGGSPGTTPDTIPPTNPRRSWSDRLRMRLQVEREIDDLTRHHDRDQRVLAEAAVRLPTDGLAIGMLFRTRARRAHGEAEQ